MFIVHHFNAILFDLTLKTMSCCFIDIYVLESCTFSKLRSRQKVGGAVLQFVISIFFKQSKLGTR